MSSYEKVITHDSFKITLKLIDINSLIPHEEVDENLLNKLIKEILDVGLIFHPILVDENSLVVIDGMHRLEALKRIGCKFVPCGLINYNDTRIKIEKWIRKTTLKEKDFVNLLNILEHESTIIKEERFSIISEQIIEKHLFLLYKNTLYYLSDLSLKQNIALLKKIDNEIRKSSYTNISFITQNEFFNEIKSDTYYDNLYYSGKLISKDEVLTVASTKELLPLKSTRHVLPFRIYYINIPINILKLPYYNALQNFVKIIKENEKNIIVK